MRWLHMVSWIVVAACTESPPPVAFDDAPVRAVGQPRSFFQRAAMEGATAAAVPFPQAFRVARPMLSPPQSVGGLAPEVLDALGASIDGAEFDFDYGAAMVDALAEEPPEDVAAFGAGTFSASELYGIGLTDGLCEQPHARFSYEDMGRTWEASLGFATWYHPTGPVQTLFMNPTAECVAGLEGSTAAAAVAESACTEEEEHGFFPDGSECRACLDEGAGFVACVAEARCDDEVPQVWKYAGEFYEWAQVEVIACAPDVRGIHYLAAADLPDDGTVPEPWDFTVWAWACSAMRSSPNGEMNMYCLPEEEPSDAFYSTAIGQGVLTWTDWIREAGTDDLHHMDRGVFIPRLSFTDGTQVEWTLSLYSGLGEVALPAVYGDGNGDGVVDDDDWGHGGGYGGWGFTPNVFRPGGDDPTDVNDLWARDFHALVVMKTSTTRAGVPINVINHSRCEEWAGPHSDGSWTCVDPGRPSFPWYEDNHVWAGSATQVIAEPMMTLGSTGLPDPSVPGGFTIHIAGTADLANPDWDACEWPNQFVPDRIRTEDHWLDWEGVASLDAHTYKFGKDPDQDIRVVLATPQERGYCSD